MKKKKKKKKGVHDVGIKLYLIYVHIAIKKERDGFRNNDNNKSTFEPTTFRVEDERSPD